MKITKSGDKYKVESTTKKGKFYIVDLKNKRCSCPGYLYHYRQKGLMCKHIVAVEYDEKDDEKEESVMDFLKELGPTDSILLLEKFGEDTIESLKNDGKVIEEKGIIRVLE